MDIITKLINKIYLGSFLSVRYIRFYRLQRHANALQQQDLRKHTNSYVLITSFFGFEQYILLEVSKYRVQIAYDTPD